MKYHKINLDFIYNHTILPEYFSFTAEVTLEIVDLLTEYWNEKKGLRKWPDLSILNLISWRPITTKGGSFTNRLKKHIKQHWDLNLPSELLHKIGNIVGLNNLSQEEYYFDIVKDFNWKAGDFGDRGSCFWQNRGDIRTAMAKEGNFYAIRFYRRHPVGTRFISYNNNFSDKELLPFKKDAKWTYYGVGRSWLYETIVNIKKGSKTIKVPCIIIFNSYGITGIQNQSMVLTSFLGRERSPVYLTNKEKTSGGLYVNGSGYVIGDANLIPTISKFDFGLDNNYDGTENILVVADDDPTPLRNLLFHKRMEKIRKYGHGGREERLKAKRTIKGQEKADLNRRDFDNRKLHQRFINKLTHDRNCSRMGLCTRFFTVNEYSDQEKKLAAKIAKKRSMDPFKIINHHIINQTIKEKHD